MRFYHACVNHLSNNSSIFRRNDQENTHKMLKTKRYIFWESGVWWLKSELISIRILMQNQNYGLLVQVIQQFTNSGHRRIDALAL